MEEIFTALKEAVDAGQTVALATIIRTAGSTPREVGAKMMIHPEGRHAGTVGGGCGEAEVMRQALDVIASRRPALVRVDLTGEISLESDGICGGVMEVLVEPWPPADEEPTYWRPLLVWLAGSGEAGPWALATRLPPAPVRHLLITPDKLDTAREISHAFGRAVERLLAERRSGLVTIPESEETWFIDVHRARPTIVIAGAGHIAVPLAQMAKMLDFRVIVIDDRPSFVNPERFPTADRLICDHFEQALRDLPIDPDTYIVIITRGHQHDVTCLRAVLGSPAAYIGMIGSRRRVRGVFELLEQEEGVPRDLLDRVHAPIGLDIGAKTPAEIALSILAEVVKVYRGGQAASLSQYVRGRRSEETAGGA